MNDSELILKIQNGQNEYFTILHNRYEDKVKSRASRFVYNKLDIEEVSQNTWIKVFRNIDKFQGDSTFYTWLYRITTNEAKNFLTSNSRRIPSYLYEEQDDKRQDASQPEDEIFNQEIVEIINHVMDNNLTSELREAVILRDFEGKSYKEISELIDRQIGTVKSRIFRARNIIDEELNKHTHRPRVDE